MPKKKENIDFTLIEIDVQHYKKQGYIKLYSCGKCYALVIEPLRAEHSTWHNQ